MTSDPQGKSKPAQDSELQSGARKPGSEEWAKAVAEVLAKITGVAPGEEQRSHACPLCSNLKVVPIFYGLIPQEEIEELRKQYGPDGFGLGGCFFMKERWLCKSCGHRFVDEK
jgi:hypothetical protein